jgi:acyl-CoA synthetase (AMP-forming)/AMP-acid ligase II
MPEEGGQGVCLGQPSSALELCFIRPTRDVVSLEGGDWADWEVRPSEGGELLVEGPHVCPGYFRNTEAFARAKVVDPDGRVWHRTGDVCTQDEEGRLWMLGRVHNAIQREGGLLFPVEAELVMKRLPVVGRAAYIGVPDATLGEAAWAVFTLQDGAEVEGATGVVRSALEGVGIPVDRVVLTADIPMDPRHHSKVDAAALKAILLDSTAEVPS